MNIFLFISRTPPDLHSAQLMELQPDSESSIGSATAPAVIGVPNLGRGIDGAAESWSGSEAGDHLIDAEMDADVDDSPDAPALKLVPGLLPDGSAGGSTSGANNVALSASTPASTPTRFQCAQPTAVGRRRKHPALPPKHICEYCGRGCQKPSTASFLLSSFSSSVLLCLSCS